MDGPILRATDAAGEVYDDPSEGALFMLMEDLQSPGLSFRVERLEPGRDDEWFEVTRREDGQYEFWGSPQHVRYVSSFREIHDFLTKWAFDLFPGGGGR
jgi:hypothetical protein